MAVVKAIYTAAVKSTAVSSAQSVFVGSRGISSDRRFLVCESGSMRMVTQRQIGRLAQVRSDYDADGDTLSLAFAGGGEVRGRADAGEPVVAQVFRRAVNGNIVGGDWGEALSDFCGANLCLVKADQPGMCFDEYPVSALSQASIDWLSGQAGGKPLSARRFRPNLLVGDCAAHEEDSWLGKSVRIGDNLRLRMVKLDPRCAITTLDPDTGERDLDTPRLLLNRRPPIEGAGAYFGVYGAVEATGLARVGDSIVVED